MSGARLAARGLSAWVGEQPALRSISLEIPAGQVTAVIGPSGCGKSVFIRCLNRMHELTEGARTEGAVEVDGQDIYDPAVDPVALRRKVGMVFHAPQPFPRLSIAENVRMGPRLAGRRPPVDVAEGALVRAGLWDEVKDRLDTPAAHLSSGDQQRLCIARALAMEPQVLLLDEPCADLDPRATARIEDVIHALRGSLTVVIVSHHPGQAARVSDTTAFFLAGELIEYSRTDRLFTSPCDPRTEDYITGKFG